MKYLQTIKKDKKVFFEPVLSMEPRHSMLYAFNKYFCENNLTTRADLYNINHPYKKLYINLRIKLFTHYNPFCP